MWIYTCACTCMYICIINSNTYSSHVYIHIYMYIWQVCFEYRSTTEEKHLRPGHCWLCQFGHAVNETSCENEFKLQLGKRKDYKGTHFYDSRDHVTGWWMKTPWFSHLINGTRQRMLKCRRCLGRWISTHWQAKWWWSEMRAVGCTLWNVVRPELEAAARLRTNRCTRGAGESMNPERFMVSVDDNEFRSRFECLFAWFFKKKKKTEKISFNH